MSALEALTKYVVAEEQKLGIVHVPLPRNHVPCRWCGGGPCDGPGCTACFNAREKKTKELDAEYKRQFPDGPKPIFTARFDNAEEMEQAKRVIGREAIEKAFGPGGAGVNEIMENATAAMASRSKEGTT